MLFRIRLRLCTPLGTPMVSGTLFGHLCWAYLDAHGEAALAEWLEAMARGEREPFLISDAFPAGHLPRPLLPSAIPPDDAPLEAARRHKRLRRAVLVPRADFLRLRAKTTREADWLEAVERTKETLGLPEDMPEDVREGTWRRVVEMRTPEPAQHAHNVIDRLRSTTPEAAGLWFVEDDWGFALLPERDVYVDTDMGADELGGLFTRVGESGYGRDVTYGRGLFDVLEVAPDREFAAPLQGEDVRRVSLSRGSLTRNMADARWRRITHFGKLAARAEGRPAADGSPARPWKKPLLLMRPGATFRPADEGPFGALLDHVHLDLPDVRFNAWHLAVPYREAAA